MLKNKKGFTLIELLAVIIILGVLMLIAIPSVTQYISNSRKSTYISSGSSYMTAVSLMVNDADGITVNDTSKVYFIPVSNDAEYSCVKLEKGGKTPFGSWWTETDDPDKTPIPTDTASAFAYVMVVMNDEGTSYSYAFVARDTAKYEFPTRQEGVVGAGEGTDAYKKEYVEPTPATKIAMPTATGETVDFDTLPDNMKVGKNDANVLTAQYYGVNAAGKCVAK